MLARCKVEIEAARARGRGQDVTVDVSMCRYHSTEMCGRVAYKVVQIFGDGATLRDAALNASTVMCRRSEFSRYKLVPFAEHRETDASLGPVSPATGGP